MAPLRGGCMLPSPTRRALRRKEKNHRPNLVFESIMNRFCIICTKGPSGLRSQGTSCHACWHWAAVPTLEMIFYRLRVDAVWQHQPFVIVGSKPKLLFLSAAHHPSAHSHSSVHGGVQPSFRQVFLLLPVKFVLALLSKISPFPFSSSMK